MDYCSAGARQKLFDSRTFQERWLLRGGIPISLSLPVPKHCVTLVSCPHCRSSWKFLALGPVCWGQLGFLEAASPQARLATGPDGLPGLTCSPVPLQGSWAVGDGVSSHRLIAIMVQPENSLECLCRAQGIHPTVHTQEYLFWQQQGRRMIAHVLWPCANAEQISPPALEEQSSTAPNLALPGVSGCLLSPQTSLAIAAASLRAPFPSCRDMAVPCLALQQPHTSAANLGAAVLNCRKRQAGDDQGYILPSKHLLRLLKDFAAGSWSSR